MKDDSPAAATASPQPARMAQAARLAFWIAAAGFLLWAALIASVTNQVGSWDSAANLIVGRNIAEGRGFVTDFVGDYAVRHQLPGPELTRPPGLPYLLAATYRIFGPTLSAHVWLNAVIVFLSALAVRTAIRIDGGTWPADVAGIAMLQVHAPLTDAWNNNPLILTTSVMLLLAVLAIRNRIGGLLLACACAVVTAIGFFMKQTFMLSGGACALLVLFSAPGRPFRARLRDCALFGALFLVLTSPYWASNLVRYGEPLYAP